MKIAIPTFNRPMLKSYELAKEIVGEDNVFVFFHNQEDSNQYPQDIKNRIITNTNKGIGIARNNILTYFEKGEQIIFMDDDITEVNKLQFQELIKLSPQEIKGQFEKCFNICEKNGCYLWGIYPVNNAFFMKNKINNKCFIIGWIMGIVINDLRFYVSDAHHKEKCANGNCCGLPCSMNYSRGQFTEAIIIAKEKGEVRFSDIEKGLDIFKGIKWGNANGLNAQSSEIRMKRQNWELYDFIKNTWNSPNNGNSPYKYFNGVLIPDKLDENGDIIYLYNKEKVNRT